MTNDRISTELQAAIVGEAAPAEHRARAAGKDLDETEPRAVKAWYAADTERVFIES